MSKTKNLLLLGASGFIGQSLEQFLSKKFRVISTNSPNTNSKLDFHSSADRVNILRNFSPDLVVNAAWCTNKKDYRFLDENFAWVESTLDFIQECNSHNVQKYITFGTFSEKSIDIFNNGDSDNSPYAESKRRLLSRILILESEINMRITWLRIGYPYGRYDKQYRLIPSITEDLINERIFEIQNMTVKLNLINVLDIVNSVQFYLSHNSETVIDVFGDLDYTIPEIVETISKVLKSEEFNEIEELPSIETNQIWRPKIDLETGISDYLSRVIK